MSRRQSKKAKILAANGGVKPSAAKAKGKKRARDVGSDDEAFGQDSDNDEGLYKARQCVRRNLATKFLANFIMNRAMFSEKDLVESALAGAGPAPQLDGDSDSDNEAALDVEEDTGDLDELMAEDEDSHEDGSLDEEELGEDEFDLAAADDSSGAEDAILEGYAHS